MARRAQKKKGSRYWRDIYNNHHKKFDFVHYFLGYSLHKYLSDFNL
jgi:hypothetical protein